MMEEQIAYLNSRPVTADDVTDIRQFENVIINGLYSAENDLKEGGCFSG